MIRHKLYSKTAPMPEFIETVISGVLKKNPNYIQSKNYSYQSDKVLAKLRKDFEAFGFRTEPNKTNEGK